MTSEHEKDVTPSEPVVEEAGAQTVAEAGSLGSDQRAVVERPSARSRGRDRIDERGSRSRRRRRRRWTEDDSDRVVDEGARLARALAVGSLRQLELIGDITGRFAGTVIDGTRERDARRRRHWRDDDDRYDDDEIYADAYDDDYDDYDDEDPPRRRRNGRSSRRRGPRGATDTFADLADDLYDGAIDAFRDLQDLPGDVVDEFYDSFDSYEPRRGRRHARRR